MGEWTSYYRDKSLHCVCCEINHEAKPNGLYRNNVRGWRPFISILCTFYNICTFKLDPQHNLHIKTKYEAVHQAQLCVCYMIIHWLLIGSISTTTLEQIIVNVSSQLLYFIQGHTVFTQNIAWSQTNACLKLTPGLLHFYLHLFALYIYIYMFQLNAGLI